ncbi:MAG: ribonuclease R [Pseudomonadota bacterium]
MARSRGLPSPDQIVEFLKTADSKVGKREIARAFGVKGADRVELKKLLRKMADDGLIATRRKRMSDASGLPPVTVVRVSGIDSDGELYGEPAEWGREGETAPKVIIAAGSGRRRSSSAKPPGIGDQLLCRLSRTDDATYPYEARIIRKLQGSRGHIVGVYEPSPRGSGRVVSANRKDRLEFEVARNDDGDARKGELVRAEIIRERGRGFAQVRIVERLGDASDQRNVSLIAIHQHGIPDQFPNEVTQAAEALKALKPPKGRKDLRRVPLVTIDPPDARDHDDAVWAAPDDDPANKGGFKTIVAIADVAAYVRAGSVIDKEARVRGNSVYFPDRVVPMLPERLSTDLCSLRGHEDRPAFACFMTVDKAGRKLNHSFERIWMKSAAKLSYAQAQAAIDGRSDEVTGPLLKPVLQPLWRAYKVLKKARDKRQPLELDLPERKLVLDADGRIERVTTPDRLDAHKLIEEFMIQANVAAAEVLEKSRTPLVFRVHEAPAPEKIDALAKFLATLGQSAPTGVVMKPQHFNRILETARGGPNEHLVSQTVLRSQAQAVYTPDNQGHFGLNLRRYAHFTSPIRRYADLIVHRALISALKLGDDGLSNEDMASLEELAGILSMTERRAMLAERETTDRLIAHYLSGNIGADFKARISGMVKAGLFVTLSDSGADGFIPASTLGQDYFVHDEQAMAMVGERTGETFRMGDLVDVRLLEVTPLAGGLRFEMLSDGAKGKPAGGRRQAGRRRPGGKAKKPRSRHHRHAGRR